MKKKPTYDKDMHDIMKKVHDLTIEWDSHLYVDAIKSLNDFWDNHCEYRKTLLGFISYKCHDHGAKGVWATIDHELSLIVKNRLKDRIHESEAG